MDDIEIEVFRADTQASRGITAADIAQVAAFDCNAHPIPNVIGHPQHDKPSVGQVKGFRAEGSTLFAKVPATAAKIWSGIKDGSILNRSMAFFHPDHEANPTPGKWAPRHLGWLGASAPGIPGMKPLADVAKGLAFSADGETLEVLGAPAEAVVFVPAPTPVFTVTDTPKPKEPAVADEKTPEQIAFEAERTAFEAEKTAFAASQKRDREAANAVVVDGHVASGKVLPAEADKLKTVFNALGTDELTFDAEGKDKGTAASALSAFIAGLPKRVPVDEQRKSPVGQFTATDTPMTGRALHDAAKKLEKDEGITFAAAVERLSAEADA